MQRKTHETTGGSPDRPISFWTSLFCSRLRSREIDPYHVQVNRIGVDFHFRDRLHYVYDPPVLTVALDGVTFDEFFYFFIFVDFFLAFRSVVVIQDTFHTGTPPEVGQLSSFSRSGVSR